MQLQEKAMLTFLTISQWTARKHDKRATEDVAQKYHVSGEAGRYNKVLIAKEELKEIQKIANGARTFHYKNTLPWSDDGNRILTAANYFTYTTEMQKLKTEFQTHVRAFCHNYQTLVTNQMQRLNGLFNPSDYPDPLKIRSKFSVDIVVSPLPDSNDFRVGLQREEITRIQNEIADREKQLLARAMRDCWSRLYEVVKHMSEKLQDKDATFRDSLVGNIINLVGLLPKLNLTNDQQLESMRKDIETKLTQTCPDDLRRSKDIRTKVAQEATELLDQMAGYVS
jgi:hypothetical protein